MPGLIQVRNVPPALHRKLKARAAQAGMSLSDYVLGELRMSGARPTPQELWARLDRRTPVKLRESSADIIRAIRDSR